MRPLWLALPFGALLGWLASRQSGPIAGLAVGLLSAAGLFMVHLFAKSRLRARQGKAPELGAGEKALLHGPGEWVEAHASAKAWIYLSSERLIVQEEGNSGVVEMKLSDIEEVRPAESRLFSSRLQLVARGRGLVTLALPDARRWQLALQEALRATA